MARRLGLALATFLFLGFAAAAEAQPQAVTPPCGSHVASGNAAAQRSNGAD